MRFVVSDVTCMPHPGESFDAVIGNSVLHHLPFKAALDECFRVLKPGGVIWLSEPNMMNPQIAVEKNIRFIGRWLDNSEDETAFFRRGLARRLLEAGFAKVCVRPFDFLHPGIPARFMNTIDHLGRELEGVPLIRELSGSLLITAGKP